MAKPLLRRIKGKIVAWPIEGDLYDFPEGIAR
jgi:hypothetical protein